MIIPIDSSTLEALYKGGHISAEALTAMVSDRPSAIAPIKWLAVHHPELLKAIRKSTQPKPLTCKSCIHFSSVHACCNTRIDDEFTYLPATETTPACKDFEGVTLLPFLKSGGTYE